jgi:hypothetical protein
VGSVYYRRMTEDPAGYYAALEVEPAAAPEAIALAFRQKARVLHPDVAGTGNARAFIRLREAYDVLSDADRRAAYDRAARAAAERKVEERLPAVPVYAEPPVRWPRFSDLPLTLWAGLGGVFCFAAMMAVVQLNRPPPPVTTPAVLPFAPFVPPSSTPIPLPPAPQAGGTATHYVLPASGDAVIWQHDAARDAYLPIGQLAAFSPVLATKLIPEHGLIEIRLGNGDSGFVDASRLNPGDRTAAHHAYCAYNAGALPQNGEVFDRHGSGGGQVAVHNRSGQPAVVKLRDQSGRAVVTVFVAPGGDARLANLPEGRYRPEFAIGEFWSRACHDFAAGVRAQRFADYAPLSNFVSLIIPPDPSAAAAPVDIPDAAFERE